MTEQRMFKVGTPRPMIGEKVQQVFEAWRDSRPRPELCRMTLERADLIRNRIRLGYTAEDLILIVRYVTQAETEDARWMRGANPRRREYLDLEHILRRQRLGERLEAARAWEADGAHREVEGDSNPYRMVGPDDD